MSEPEPEEADPRRLYADDGTLLFVADELADMTPEQRERIRTSLQQNVQLIVLLD